MDTVSRSARFRAPSAAQLVFFIVSQIHTVPTKHRGCLLGRSDNAGRTILTTRYLFLFVLQHTHGEKGRRDRAPVPFPLLPRWASAEPFFGLWTWSEADVGKQESSVVCDRLRAAPGSRQLGTDDGDPSARDSGAASADPWFPVSNANTLRASDATSTPNLSKSKHCKAAEHTEYLAMSNRILTSIQQARLALLKKIYKPAAHLQKGSIEYEKLARSGRVWEDYFTPGNSLKMGYVDVQRKLTGLLNEIDHLRGRLPVMNLGKTLVAEYAQQSVMIENNPLSVTGSIRIFDRLRSGLEQVGLASTPSSELARLVTMWTAARGADVTESATNELQNHIIASQWIAENAAAKAGTAGLCEAEVRDLAVVLKKAGGNLVWGSRVPLGEYRNLPISVRSNRLKIFPYSQEVPACMERFFQWRDLQHREKALHPLILACQMTAYFVLVHPFPDSNGRTSRMVKQDYLARQGYVPVVIRNLQREDCLRMIDGASQDKPGEFVTAVLEAQLAVLHQASARLKM
ncbi:fic/DOC family protein [Colletotrichum nymphaeae SA-01]|uniref:Fic/DOC family protein n=1 Tax=Colletotrichum nymphaeae SA-01 TaxID=1460502 RepID=A0A135S595_9PEZI|nr:fic/DOC family protein [Colletotrichum nymphaeae SA-01]